MNDKDLSESDLAQLTDLRHKLHQSAEVSGAEETTAGIIKDFLKKECTPDALKTGVGGYGILATYEGSGKGPHILLRCELDALPIADVNEISYQSENEGVGHKCGHDGHMSILCGVAKRLSEQPPEIGKVTLLFQPAEETGEGARKVIEDENFQELSPDFCFALHNLPGFEKDQIVVRSGVFAAASVGLITRFKGDTAHAAHPEQGKSPALAMAQTVQAFSSAPQFYSPLEEAAKVTVINAELGERAFGTSPGHAVVMATLRTYSEQVLDQLKKKCLDNAKGAAGMYDLSFSYDWVEPFPVTENDSDSADTIRKSAEINGFEIHDKEFPFSWSEDFGHFTKQIPGVMFGLGIGKDHAPLHAEDYDFEDEVIPTGVRMFVRIIEEISSKSNE